MTTEASIERWMQEIIDSEGYVRFDDLHIDEVDPAFASSPNWINGTIKCFRIAVKVRDERSWHFVVVAGISLRENSEKLSITPLSLKDLTSILSDAPAPPSLYLFPENALPLLSDPDTRELRDFADPLIGPNTRIYFRERFEAREGAYLRSLFMVG